MCGEFQIIEWGFEKEYGIQFDIEEKDPDRAGETARYRCRHCAGEFHEHHKEQFLAARPLQRLPQLPCARPALTRRLVFLVRRGQGVPAGAAGQ